MFRNDKLEIDQEYERKFKLVSDLIPNMSDVVSDKVNSCKRFNEVVDEVSEIIQKWSRVDFEELKFK